MTVESEVATLTTAVDNLTTAVNVQKSTLDASVANALSHAGTASTHKTGAETAKSGAESARDQAYTYSQSAASAVTYQDLTAIAESKSGTAVDVFVYDTSKDSDGGQWRKRCQHTSWYNEASSSTRGSRKDFPAVAVIVAEASKVTIYDGDDPSMPMWMVFSEAAWNQALGQFTRTAVTALNGIIVNTSSQSGAGGQVNIIQFIDETILSRRSTGGTQRGKYLGNIAERNAAKNWDLSTDQSIVNQYANDCAMTVLPNAPIDSATNLPTPTIAVATDGGVSVIKDDGSVVDITNTQDGNAFNFCMDVHFRSDGGLVWSADSSGNVAAPRFIQVLHEIPTSDFVHTSVANSSNIDEFYSRNITSQGDFKFISSAGLQALQKSTGRTNVGTSDGLSSFAYNKTTPEEGLGNYITSDYNTGWMHGDIKLAALSATDDTDVVGSELVTNGDFSNGTTDWAAAGSGATIAEVNNELVVTRNGTSAYAKQTFNTVAGQWYKVTYTVVSRSHSYRVTCNSAGLATSSTTGTFSFDFKADAATEELRLHCYNSSTATVTFDNVSVRLADHDRSVNGNGLAVHGTIDKDPVATGAELVGYSFGPSTAHGAIVNYLSQPDFTFPSGDASIMFWTTSTAGDAQMFTVGATTSAAPANGINMWMWSSLIKTNWAGVAVNTPAGSLHSGQQFICVVRRGSTIEVYIDGALSQTGTSSTAISETGLTIGNGYYNAGGDDMALFRISATAPTAEQIAKIYEDEKPLFQENAKATLYGSSDAVTALAHDDDTGLLHVGTSAGRSVFKGLRRVSNTTDAVGTAISASNDLVVEE